MPMSMSYKSNFFDFQKVLTGAGERWTQDEAAQLLEDLMVYDKNGDGKFDYLGKIFGAHILMCYNSLCRSCPHIVYY